MWAHAYAHAPTRTIKRHRQTNLTYIYIFIACGSYQIEDNTVKMAMFVSSSEQNPSHGSVRLSQMFLRQKLTAYNSIVIFIFLGEIVNRKIIQSIMNILTF